MTLTTKQVQELPAKPLIYGEAVYYSGENDNALEVVDWLREHGITAWAIPRSSNWAGMIRVDSPSAFNEDTLAWQDCWIIVQPNKDVVISPNNRFEKRFIEAGQTVALYKDYEKSI